ncbi:MAG: cold-shock protein [Casimicrobiaceae bacterium]
MSKVAVVVNGQTWDDLGRSADLGRLGRALSLRGLTVTIGLEVGAQLGRTMEQLALGPLVFCRARATGSDADAVASGFEVLNTPQVDGEDTGAGLSLEAMRVHALAKPDAIVLVGATMPWLPLRKRLESAGCELFEFVIPSPGKVLVDQTRLIDLRAALRDRAEEMRFAPMLIKATPPSGALAGAPAAAPSPSPEPKAANAILGRVKMLAAGYGIVTRNDGGGDVEFMATQVAPPGFEFIEIGDTLRFDVVAVANGKWQAVRVVRA